MRKIEKTVSPTDFEKFKYDIKRDNGCDTKFDDLQANEKRKLKEELIKEQFGLCCYCMKKIDWYNSHVEHFISDDLRGKETIKHLELDNELLTRARRSAIYISGFFDEELDDDMREELIREYSIPEGGELPAFCKAVTYCLEQEEG